MRLTGRNKENKAELIGGANSLPDALERLASFEDLVSGVEDELAGTQAVLEELKAEGKTKSVRFREKLGLKMFLSEVLNLLERYRLYSR